MIPCLLPKGSNLLLQPFNPRTIACASPLPLQRPDLERSIAICTHTFHIPPRTDAGEAAEGTRIACTWRLYLFPWAPSGSKVIYGTARVQ